VIRVSRESSTISSSKRGTLAIRTSSIDTCEDVSASVVREAVRNTTNPDWQVDTPTFEEIFHAVRGVNLALPAEKRLRILLGDPPFDWTAVKSAHDLYFSDRDRFVADLVLRESAARKRRTLIVYGQMHYRRSDRQSIVTYLEAAGQKVFSIANMTPGTAIVRQSDVRSWPLPSLTVVHGTVLGAAELIVWNPLPLQQQVDAVLLDALAPGRVPREFCDDPEYMKMRLFRMDLRGQGDQLRRYCGVVK
jgi:hypothetical protein